MTDYDKLIPELPQWNNGKGISIGAYLSCVGQFEHAVAYANLFWPDFVLFEGCLLQQVPDQKNFAQWMATCNGNKSNVESMMNHLHLADLFHAGAKPPTVAILNHLGQCLKEMWQCKLARDFPNLPVQVEYTGADCPDLLEHVITVFVQR